MDTDIITTLRKIVATLDTPVQRNDYRNGAACDILRTNAGTAIALARSALARACGEEE